MSYLIALEVQFEDLVVAVAKTSGKRMQLERCFLLPKINEREDSEIGNELKSLLAELRVNKCEAVAVVSRQNAEIREITVPPSPDSELPEMIRFKARNDFGSLNENWSLDFVPFSEDESVPREVLAAAVPPSQIERYQAICETANLKLKHILFGPFAAADLLRPKLIDGACRLIVNRTRERINLTVTEGPRILTTRSVKPGSMQDDAALSRQLIGEANRTIASASRRLDGKTIDRLMILQSDDAFTRPLQESLGLEVETIDPFELVPHHPRLNRPDFSDRLASVFGALLQQDAGLGHEIDFLNPRRKEVKQIDVRRYLIIAGAAAFGFFCLCLIGWWVLRNQSSEIQALTMQKSSLEAENTGLKDGVQVGVSSDQIIGEVGKVDAWQANDVNWLDELYEISERFMTPDDAIVDSFEANLRGNTPTIQLIGRLKGAESDRELKQVLMKRPFQVAAPKTTMTEDDTYPQSYEYTLTPKQDLTAVIKSMDEQTREFLRGLSNPKTNTNTNNTETKTTAGK